MAVIFVFGSNLAGRHGKGAALEAVRNWGAIRGCGAGAQGRSYAIPTKDGSLKKMPLGEIKPHVSMFLNWARDHPDDQFIVTAIGCGLAGYDPKDIAPMFSAATENVFLSAKLADGIRK